MNKKHVAVIGATRQDGEIFDHKKRFHELLFASGIGWTLYYNL